HDARPHHVLEFIKAHPGLKWTTPTLPPLPETRSKLGALMERLSVCAPEWWNRTRQAHLYSQMSARHRLVLRELVNSPRVEFGTIYKRIRPAGCRAELRADGIAGCLRTPRGGSSKQFLVVAGKGQWRVRNMTAREYARLQGVPDSFNIK